MSHWNIQSLTETLLIGSTLIEGSTLSEGQARDVLAGKTVQGHFDPFIDFFRSRLK